MFNMYYIYIYKVSLYRRYIVGMAYYLSIIVIFDNVIE